MRTNPHNGMKWTLAAAGAIALIGVCMTAVGWVGMTLAEPDPVPPAQVPASVCAEALDASMDVLDLHTQMLELHPKSLRALQQEDYAALEAFDAQQYALADRLKTVQDSVYDKADKCRNLTQPE